MIVMLVFGGIYNSPGGKQLGNTTFLADASLVD